MRSRHSQELYADIMDGGTQEDRLLSLEEKWKIIFNETTRAPIYAVDQYLDHLTKFISSHNAASEDSLDAVNITAKKDSIDPVSYLLRKLKLDMKMSYDSFIEDFVNEPSNGMSLLVQLLKAIQSTGSRFSGSASKARLQNYKKALSDEHDCLLCIKYSLRVEGALNQLLNIVYGLETVAMCLMSTFLKSRGTAIEILTLALSAKEGFSRVLDCFTYLRLKIGEPVRFKFLINMLNVQGKQNIVFQVSCMKFLNALVNGADTLNTRVFIQEELKCAGLDMTQFDQICEQDGLAYDDLRQNIHQWRTRYIDVDTLATSPASSAKEREIENLRQQIRVLMQQKNKIELELKMLTTAKRNKRDASTQCHKTVSLPMQEYETLIRRQLTTAYVTDVGCQCDIDRSAVNVVPSKHRLTKVYAGHVPKGPAPPPPTAGRLGSSQKQSMTKDPEHLEEESSTEKVNDWLHFQSDDDFTQAQIANETRLTRGQRQTPRHHSDSDTHQFDSNWAFAPPSRSPEVFMFNCENCDAFRLQERNAYPSQNFQVPRRLFARHVDRNSYSSDSAIGGSAERLWQGKEDSYHLTGLSGEELQDQITPDDSASACPVPVEPYPDYSTIKTKDNYASELSRILKEFEGALSGHEGNKEYVPRPKFSRFITVKAIADL